MWSFLSAALRPFLEYLEQRVFYKKMLDVVFVILLLVAGYSVYFTHINVDRISDALFRDFSEKFVENLTAALNAEPALERMRIQTGADSAVLFRYHNGTEGINHFSFIRKSATNIVGSNVEIDRLQQLPTSADTEQLLHHINGECIFRSVDDANPFVSIFRLAGIRFYGSCPVFIGERDLIGYVSVHWLEEIEMNAEIEQVVLTTAREIGYLESVNSFGR